MASAPPSPRSFKRAPHPALASLDLNLLVAFGALWAERSVTRAGQALGLSQSAMSGALARLRAMMGDPLFVRTKDGLTPTERCVELAEPIARALRDLQCAVEGRAFDPATSSRWFALGAVDAAIRVVMPELVRRVAESAPGVRLSICSVDPAHAAELVDEGALDLALAPVASAPATVASRVLFPIGLRAVMRRGHPLGTRALGLKELAEWPAITVAFRSTQPTPIDLRIAALGVERRVLASVDSFLAVPPLLAAVDAIAILPAPFALALEGEGFVSKELPDGARGRGTDDGLKMRMLWSERQAGSPALRWLRDLVVAVACVPKA